MCVLNRGFSWENSSISSPRGELRKTLRSTPGLASEAVCSYQGCWPVPMSPPSLFIGIHRWKLRTQLPGFQAFLCTNCAEFLQEEAPPLSFTLIPPQSSRSFIELKSSWFSPRKCKSLPGLHHPVFLKLLLVLLNNRGQWSS